MEFYEVNCKKLFRMLRGDKRDLDGYSKIYFYMNSSANNKNPDKCYFLAEHLLRLGVSQNDIEYLETKKLIKKTNLPPNESRSIIMKYKMATDKEYADMIMENMKKAHEKASYLLRTSKVFRKNRRIQSLKHLESARGSIEQVKEAKRRRRKLRLLFNKGVLSKDNVNEIRNYILERPELFLYYRNNRRELTRKIKRDLRRMYE